LGGDEVKITAKDFIPVVDIIVARDADTMP
jgi:hypothetical protein